MESELCVICKKPLDGILKFVKLKKKGSDSINNVSLENNETNIFTSPGQTVHVNCRRDYIHCRNKKKSVLQETMNVNTRSVMNFDFKTKCLFCGRDAKLNHRKRALDVFPVRTMEFQERIRELCLIRKDEWSEKVLGRLSLALDLPAADAVYHRSCSVNFRTKKAVPKQFTDSGPCKKLYGRPDSIDTGEAFQSVVSMIKENRGSVFTLSELTECMKEDCGERAFTNKYMKKKLMDFFGDNLSIIASSGKEDKIMLQQTASDIVYDFANSFNEYSEQEKKQKIITAAAKMIKTEINMITSNKEFYPTFSDISSTSKNHEFVSEGLKLLLDTIIGSTDTKIEVASFGQAIIQACRPRNIISPLQIGLAVQLHHTFGSRFLIDLLNNLGFCSSYHEVQRFESSAAACINTSIPNVSSETFLQFVADNADHNVGTLDGHGTFHGMGIIACTTPGTKFSRQIPRTVISTNELKELGTINIKHFSKFEWVSKESLKFENVYDNELLQGPVRDQNFDTFSKVLWPLISNRPNWSGFMQTYYHPKGDHPGKSNIIFLPMIDMNASDLSCIYSTLCFVSEQSKKYGVTPVITFDQPLFQKATYIVDENNSSSQLKNIVLRLGAFHTQMSFLGCIGHLMSGTGLSELLQTVYAPNTVGHMMSGKAVSRAIRGHFLVDTALHAVLMSDVFEISLPGDELIENDKINFLSQSVELASNTSANNTNGVSHLEDLKDLYNKLTTHEVSKEDVISNDSLTLVMEKINDKKSQLSNNRTAQLWFQYMDMVSLLQRFIRAERTGDWIGHLIALQDMLPFFASSGHNLYLKSGYTYLQKMLKLPVEHPDIHKKFLEGNHCIRRSDRFWAGVSTDLTIEQVLMKSIKSTGGLTRGRGMTEQQRTLWVMSMPACAEMNSAMQLFSGTDYETSEQHKDVGQSRSSRDESDTKEMIMFLRKHQPFDQTDTSLRNIETGVTAEKNVNVDQAKSVGHEILSSMLGCTIDTFSFKRSKQAITMNDKISVKVSGDSITLDPQLLFQRITAVADRYVNDISTIFKYELCSIPSSLFDNDGLPRIPQKALLADAIWKMGDCSYQEEQGLPNNLPDSTTQYVLDGGSLLQKIHWPKNETFREICQHYYNFITRRYPVCGTTVVFDGYLDGPSTKDVTHLRRSKGKVDTVVNFTFETPFRSNKECFLRNPVNKHTFINLLGQFFIEKGICVHYARADADRLIVETAVELARTCGTVVIGEDTDLLILLCYHLPENRSKVLFRSGKLSNQGKPLKIWDIQKTQSVLSRNVCQLLPFLHALTGCDTTSRIFGIGKSVGLKALQKSTSFQQLAADFMVTENKNDVVKIGEMAIKKLFDIDSEKDLDVERFHRFARSVIKSPVCVQVQSLPPTSAATTFHSLRVFYQTNDWISNKNLCPEDWGWELKDGRYIPIKTNLPPAPEYLLNVVRCNCKRNCDTKKCTCRKHGLECSIGCGSCRGVGCSNSHEQIDSEI